MESDLMRVTKLLEQSHWMLWKFQVKILLNDSELLEVVTGEDVKPHDKAENFKDWVKNDKKAQKIIVTTIGRQPTLHIMQCKSSKEMWDKLHSIYEHKSSTGVHYLQQQFYSLNKDPSDDMATHIAKLESVVQQLRDMGENISDSMVSTKILMTLPNEYDHFHSAWESTSKAEQTLTNLMSRLMVEESRLQKKDTTETSEALMAKRGRNSKISNSKPKSRVPGKCFKCKQIGHWKKDCPLLKTQSQPFNRKASNSDALMCQTEELNDDVEWYLDSGASDHMTNDKQWLCNYVQFSVPKDVKIGNGDSIMAYGVGDVNVLAYNNKGWEPKYLEKVLFVPHLKLNLFSQGQVLDKGYVFRSNKDTCEFLKRDCIVAVGVRKQKLFKMLFKVIVSNNKDDRQVNAAIKQEPLKLWHERLAHQNIIQVKSFLKSMNIPYSESDLFVCDDCLMNKQERSSFPDSSSKATRSGEIIHSDVCGPMQEISYGGSKYFVLFKDDFSHYRMVYFMKNKFEVIQHLKKFTMLLKKDTGNDLKILRTDNGTEFVNKEVENFLSAHGIRHQRSVPYTPQQNGRAEREMRTIVEAARTMIHSKQMSLKFWAEAINTAVYILNRTGRSSVPGVTPYELWFGNKPRVEHLRVFGSEVFIHVPDQNRRKWDKKADKGLFVGYPEDTKGYRVWNSNSNKIQISCDVKFKESLTECCITHNNKNDIRPDHKNVNEEDANIRDEVLVKDSVQNNDVPPITLQESPCDDQQNVSSIRERLRSNKKLSDLICSDDSYAFLMDYQEPANYQEAVRSSDSDRWIKAMDEEYSALLKNHTWKLVSLPRDKKMIDNRWLYKIKYKKDGSIERYKARLVVRGFTQQYGIDYLETFSPVVRFTSIRALLAIAAQENLILRQFDIKTAFLHGDIDADIFMQQPEGYNDGSNNVCKLNKSLYGLKQSSRCWNQKFVKFLNDFGLQPTKADPCVFVNCKRDNKILLAIYIDDGLIAASNEELIKSLLSNLQSNFEIQFGEAECYLGMEIERTHDGSIFLHQNNYANRVMRRFYMTNCNQVSTPAEPDHSQDVNSKPVVKFPYREGVGSLMYLAVATRPDISFAVGYISRFMENPTDANVVALKRVLKYIKGTIGKGILYKSKQNNFLLSSFSDADYAGDQSSRRSTSGYVFLLGTGAVSWSSEKQKCVALSTTESEYIAASQTIKEMIWLKQLIADLTPSTNEIPVLYMDNQSAIKLIKNPEFHKRTKHIDVRYHFIREKYEEGAFEIEYVASAEQMGDIFTKALCKIKFDKFRSMIGVCNLPTEN